MKSTDILAVKKSIEDYLEAVEMPWELKRMLLKDIYINVERKAYEEAMNEVKENENACKRQTYKEPEYRDDPPRN